MSLLGFIFRKVQKKSRNKKYAFFMKVIRPKSKSLILDVGCGQGTFLEEKYPHKKNIIALDVNPEYIKIVKKKYPEIKVLKASGLKLPFKDKSIDVVFSNAVIEHVGGLKEQKIFAQEIMRVAKSYFVTVPNKYFPLEPHYRVPFYQFVSKSFQKWLSKKISIGNYKKGEWEDINLLSAKKLKSLFPSSILHKHRVLVSPETLICYKR